MRKLGQILSLLIAVLSFSATARAEGVTVFAAASLKTALEEIASAYRAATGTPITLSFAGSAALARQIERGAPADLYISANPDWMDYLEGKGVVDSATKVSLLGNRLALAVQGEMAIQVAITPELDLCAMLGLSLIHI